MQPSLVLSCVFVALGLLSATLLLGQPNSPHARVLSSAHNKAANATSPKPPATLTASDGVYEDYVLIRWDDAEAATQFKVFRSTDPKGAGLQELTPVWKKSNWLCDYGALPGVKYFYTVAASDGKNTSKLSHFDQGFVKNKSTIANEEGLLSQSEVLATMPRIFLLLQDLATDRDEYLPGEPMELSFHLQNVHSQVAPPTELRYVLSEDTRLDWEDVLLAQKTYVDFPAEASHPLTQRLDLPADLRPGTYYIIAIASPEGVILHSKTATTEITIKN